MSGEPNPAHPRSRSPNARNYSVACSSGIYSKHIDHLSEIREPQAEGRAQHLYGETAGGQDRGIWVKDVGVRRADMRGSLSFQYSAQGGQVAEERRVFPAIGPARKTSEAGWVGKSGSECYL